MPDINLPKDSEIEKTSNKNSSPKMIIKRNRKLMELFPSKETLRQLNLQDNSFKQASFNFFKKKEKKLDITEITGLIIDINHADYPISNFKSLKENGFNKKVLKKAKALDDTQVILISNSKNYEKYIVKRFLSSYTYLKSKYLSLDGIEFIEQKYNEYSLTSQFANDDDKFTDKPIHFEMFLLIDQSFICIEIFQEYAGEPITKYIPITNSETLLSIFKRIIKLLLYLEEKKYPQNDIKCENILFLNSQIDLRLIDFDIASLNPITVRNNRTTNLTGYSLGYMAPEIKQLLHKEGMNSTNKLINPWKAQIYSLGIVMLRLMGCLTERDLLQNLDVFKLSSQNYEVFINKLNQVKNEDDILKTKIFEIIKICIQYNPSERLFANELVALIKNINEKEISKIKEEYVNIY